MLKNAILTGLMAAASASACAASTYFVVVPLTGKTTSASPISVELAGYALPQALVGRTYDGFDLNSLLQVKGEPNFTGYGVKWAVEAGSLPAGLVLDEAGRISGTPTEAADGAFTVRATYKNSSGAQSYQIVALKVTVALTAVAMPQAQVGVPYAGYDLTSALRVTGDSAFSPSAVTWSVVSGSLPPGLALGANGRITGTPTAAANGSFTVRAAYRSVSGQQTYQIVSLNISVALADATPPVAVVGVAYKGFDLNSVLNVSGDPAFKPTDVTWALAAGTLPDGLTLDATGKVSGTPTAAASSTVTVKASYKSVSGERAYQLIALKLAVVLDPATLPAARVSLQYAPYDFKQLLKVTGEPGFDASLAKFKLVSGTLPEGLVLSEAGILSGTPTTKNTGSTIKVQADYREVPAEREYTIVVNGVALRVTQVSSGAFTRCAVTTAGGVKCWGLNDLSQLGNSSRQASSTPMDIPGLASGVREVHTARNFACALTTAGGVKCWGGNEYGTLGVGWNGGETATPVDVVGLTSGVTSLSLYHRHACAAKSDGTAYCWGDNTYGQLGNGTYTLQRTPVRVGSLTGVTKVAAGLYFSCGVLSSGTVTCWGSNQYGQLGVAGTSNRPSPVTLSNMTGVSQIGAGDYHACAIVGAGLKCWGRNDYGQLGNGAKADAFNYNLQTVTVDRVVDGLVVHGSSNFVRTASGGMKAWGFNANGELGNGTKVDGTRPSDVYGMTSGVSRIGAYCAVDTSNVLSCWGMSLYGTLGDHNQNSTTPVKIAP